MSYREQDILHESGDFWVLRIAPGHFEVLENAGTHSVRRGTYSAKSRPDWHARYLAMAVADCDRRAGNGAPGPCPGNMDPEECPEQLEHTNRGL